MKWLGLPLFCLIVVGTRRVRYTAPVPHPITPFPNLPLSPTCDCSHSRGSGSLERSMRNLKKSESHKDLVWLLRGTHWLCPSPFHLYHKPLWTPFTCYKEVKGNYKIRLPYQWLCCRNLTDVVVLVSTPLPLWWIWVGSRGCVEVSVGVTNSPRVCSTPARDLHRSQCLDPVFLRRDRAGPVPQSSVSKLDKESLSIRFGDPLCP